MGAIKRYFSNEFKWKMFTLEHENCSDFYLSAWQKNRSALPLFLLRLVLFLGSLGILISSLVISGIDENEDLSYWFIYMTNWGVTCLPITTGLAFAVSWRAYFYGPIDSSLSLPWYVKLYWISYSTVAPIAFLITVFYWSFLAGIVGEDNDYAPNVTLDIFIHGINSVVMFVLLMSARQPTRIFHFYMPLGFGVVYTIFGAIYIVAGGTDASGNAFIYPMFDWFNPGPTVAASFLTFGLNMTMHLATVVLVIIRDVLSKCCIGDNRTLSIS